MRPISKVLFVGVFSSLVFATDHFYLFPSTFIYAQDLVLMSV